MNTVKAKDLICDLQSKFNPDDEISFSEILGRFQLVGEITPINPEAWEKWLDESERIFG